MEIVAIINGIIPDTQRISSRIQGAIHTPLIDLYAIEIDDVLGAIVHHHHMGPNIRAERGVGIHVAATGSVGMRGEYRFSVTGEGYLPALLPASEGEDVTFSLCRKGAWVDPEADGRIGRVERRGIRSR